MENTISPVGPARSTALADGAKSAAPFKHAKLLYGWYRVSGEHYFSNIRLSGKRGTLGCWSADLRVRETGDLRQYAGLWDTKREAIEEAERLIARYDALFVEGALA